MKQRIIFALILFSVVLLVAACGATRPPSLGQTDAVPAPVSDAGTNSELSATETGGDDTPTDSQVDVAESDAVVADSDPLAAPTQVAAEEPSPADTRSPVPTPEPLFYNLPSTKLLYSSVLYASPNRSETVIPAPIPEGQKVYVMGRNATRTHLRVVWNTGVGWIPVGFTDFNNQQDRLSALPVFEREPPSCAIPVTTQFALASQWTSDSRQRIAVVVDLFRSRFGDFPQTSLLLKVNEFPIEETRREIVEDGQFSLKDVVFTIDQYLQPGDVLGYILDTPSDEPLTFMATIFSVPDSCVWETR